MVENVVLINVSGLWQASSAWISNISFPRNQELGKNEEINLNFVDNLGGLLLQQHNLAPHKQILADKS